jgi:hypothetical protein
MRDTPKKKLRATTRQKDEDKMLKFVGKETPPTGAEILPFIAKALEEGRDPISDPSRYGGIFVPENIVAIVADMELVIQSHFGGRHQEFHLALLAEIARATTNGDDPIDEDKLWLDSCIEDGSSLSA